MNKKKIPYNQKEENPIIIYGEVKPSKIHGLGLFAKKYIPQGTIWWHARPQDVIIVTKDQFLNLDNSIKNEATKAYIEILLTYSYYERELDALIFCVDNSRYVNHSYDANSGASEDENGFIAVAQQDIELGEEITEDYAKYTLCSWLKKYKKYFDPCCW
ncbi:MAG: SET domain-containing protein-lysine N-methyltransferase [Promethearchaeota archaeon]|nr:MAG: SET domain-containing protein-lysine N-methyltransferase [Candidatus Lokiarchaeota archaeon]